MSTPPPLTPFLFPSPPPPPPLRPNGAFAFSLVVHEGHRQLMDGQAVFLGDVLVLGRFLAHPRAVVACLEAGELVQAVVPFLPTKRRGGGYGYGRESYTPRQSGHGTITFFFFAQGFSRVMTRPAGWARAHEKTKKIDTPFFFQCFFFSNPRQGCVCTHHHAWP